LAASAEGPLGCPCDGRHLVEAWRYDRPPDGETRFAFSGEGYRRSIDRCELCGHFVSRHPFGSELYGGGYVDATYGNELAASFRRVMSLPPTESDNAARVARVAAFARERLVEHATVLDVGSGLCVFLARMQEHGFRGTALDPDPRAAAHARDGVGVEAVCGDFMILDDLGTFDLVTFNKVLEHVEDPVAMLARSAANVAPGGLVYVEVPDGDAAAAEGPEREEFFVEHLHIFSPASLALLAARAGFSLLHVERLHEPSTKYTLAAFLSPRV
jgi:SAM-dependent methyltransferase